MDDTYRHIFDNLSAEYKTFDDNKRIVELEELIQNRTFERQLLFFKKCYKDRSDVLSNIGDTLYDLVVSVVEIKRKVSTHDAMKYLLQAYQLGHNPLSDIIATLDKDGTWIKIQNPHKKTEHELVKIIEFIIMDLKY